MTDGAYDANAVVSIVRDHPAVADALITTYATHEAPTVWIVPDERNARMLHRSVVIDAAGQLGGLNWHEPADGLRVAGLNRGETDFLHREIFSGNSYFPTGSGLPANAVVVDVGANIGMFTLHAAFQSPGARIVAVEPVAELAEAIRINAQLHGVAVDVVCSAVGQEAAETEFTFYPHNTVMSSRFADTAEDHAVLRGYLLAGTEPADGAQLDRLVADRMVGQRRRVPVTTLTDIARTYGLDHIDVLKIDVEKAEMDVLAGVADTLWPRIDRVVMEVHDLDGRLEEVQKLLHSKGFEVSTYQDPRLVLTPCHFVTAHRPVARPVAATMSGAEPPVARGPTLRELERDLRRLIAGQAPAVEVPQRFALVADLSRVQRPVPDRALGSTRRTAELARAWAALFGADAVRPDADFFDLGGNSLMVIRLLDQLEQSLGEEILTPEIIFSASTLGAIAAAMEAGGPADIATEPSDA